MLHQQALKAKKNKKQYSKYQRNPDRKRNCQLQPTDAVILILLFELGYLTTNHLIGAEIPRTGIKEAPEPEVDYYPGLLNYLELDRPPSRAGELPKIPARLFPLRIRPKDRAGQAADLSLLSGRKRLSILFQAGLIDRPPEQVALKARMRINLPLIYGLGQAGAAAVAQLYGRPEIVEKRWSERNQRIKNLLDHEINLSDAIACVLLACLKKRNVRFITQSDIVKRRKTAPVKPERPLSWIVKADKYVYAIEPDYAFGLRFYDEKKKKNTEKYYFVEFDNMTEAIETKKFARASIYKKMQAYRASYKNGLISQHFDFKNFRSLFITRSEERLKGMHAVNQRLHPKGQGYAFLKFGLYSAYDMTQPEKVLGKMWHDGHRPVSEQNNLID